MLSVLLVEDYLPMSILIARLLEEDGNITVTAVSKAEEALAYLENLAKDGNEFPNLVLIDLSLPGMSGIELLKILQDKYPQILCIALSGHKHIALINEVLDLGAGGYVLKDHAHLLKEAIDHVLAGKVYTSLLPPG
jgi:DNA-binding NarL/FixJ family response regulator